MTNFRENLVNRVIRLYGFEHFVTIEFCKLAESYEDNAWNDAILETAVQAFEANPYFYEEE